MLRIIQNTSAAGAKSYYSTADYYSEGQELAGQWRGEGAKRLGLSGEVRKTDWDALCDNRDPLTGNDLTLRRKDYRRIGYDFNFHVPKSVSVLYGLTQDERLLTVFRESVNETMSDMEAEMKTRVRKRGKNEDRTTGNMVWGEFVHTTSRPVDGVPDPHLHAHCFVFNTTFDQQENTWKAGQFADLKRDGSYFEAVFHSRLARRMEELGLEVERTKKGWELAGMSSQTLTTFSRRTAQIEEEAHKQGIVNPEMKSELGAKTRERKKKNLSQRELMHEWSSRLDDGEKKRLRQIAGRIGGNAIAEDKDMARAAVAHAAEHCFERKSVVPERTVLAESLRRAVGKSSQKTVERQFRLHDFIVGDVEARSMVTTRTVVAEEKGMIDFARRGRGSRRRLGSGKHQFRREWLNGDQRQAVEHVLGSRDRVVLVRGAAGVGKTSMMKEAVDAIETGGHHVFVFAPSASASRGTLREKEQFANAETVARLLKDEKLQTEARGQVLWVDEAGLLGTRTMAQLFNLAERIDARVILSGDKRQHGSVERGAALHLLEEQAGLRPAEIKDIQRQSGEYKQAIQALSEGRTMDGFRQLDDLNWIREVSEADRYKLLASDYIRTTGEGHSALIVSPTHREAERITAEVREQLKAKRLLGGEERRFAVLENANLTQAERADAVNYVPGDVLVFHQNAKGFQKGQRVEVGAKPLPLDQAARFQAFHAGFLDIAPGDTVRATQNGMTADGKHRLDNGTLYRVKKFDGKGNIVLENGWTVAKDFGFLAPGYAVTSHASQGMTVDYVFIGQSSESYRASSREQFYVSCSRGRLGVQIYTDNKEDLLDAVRQSDDRLSATEFLAAAPARDRTMVLQRGALMPEHPASLPAVDSRREEIAYDR
jgi:conjugative relaxase-like TrwC/TraI family protein